MAEWSSPRLTQARQRDRAPHLLLPGPLTARGGARLLRALRASLPPHGRGGAGPLLPPSPPSPPIPSLPFSILSIGAFIPSSPRCRPPHEAPWLGGCGLASSSAPPSPGAAGPAPASLRWSHNSSRAKPRTGSGCARRWSACAPPASATCARMPTRPASGTRGCRSLPARLAGRVSGAAVAASSAERVPRVLCCLLVPVAADPGAYRRDENTRDLMRLSRPSAALACSV